MPEKSPQSSNSFDYSAKPTPMLVRMIENHAPDGESIHSDEALLRTIAEVDPDELTEAVTDIVLELSFQSRQELVEGLAALFKRQNEQDAKEIDRIGNALEERWEEIRSGSPNSGEQLGVVLKGDACIYDYRARIARNNRQLMGLRDGEFDDEVEAVYQQQPKMLAERLVKKRRELSVFSRFLGTVAASFVFGFGAGGFMATQNVKPEVTVATGLMTGGIGAATGYIINSRPGTMDRAARRSARRKLSRNVSGA